MLTFQEQLKKDQYFILNTAGELANVHPHLSHWERIKMAAEILELEQRNASQQVHEESENTKAQAAVGARV
jgi:hypothetical protein